MKTKDGFIQGANGQAAANGAAQIIVAQDVTQSATDHGQLVAMTSQAAIATIKWTGS